MDVWQEHCGTSCIHEYIVTTVLSVYTDLAHLACSPVSYWLRCAYVPFAFREKCPELTHNEVIVTISLRTSYKLGVPSVLLTLLGECRRVGGAYDCSRDHRHGPRFRHFVQNNVWVSVTD